MPLLDSEQQSGGFVRDADGREVVTLSGGGGGAAAPVVVVAPVASGNAGTIGNVVSCTTGSWTHSPTSFSYQWQRAGVNIPGATLSEYAITAPDVDQVLSCAVTAFAATGVSSSNSVAGGSPYNAAVLADTPVGFWQLAELSGTVAADSSGNAHDGGYVGSFTLGAAGPCSDGKKALVVTGSGWVSIPHAAQLAVVGDLTLEGWIKVPAAQTYGWLITKDVSYTPSSYDFAVFGGAATPWLGRASTYIPNADSGISIGSWNHVAVTVAGPITTYYINGAPVGTRSNALFPVDGGAAVLIGTRGDFYTPLSGSIAKVAVYDTALSGARIAAHYAAR